MLLLPVAFCTPMHKHECDLNIEWGEGANVIMCHNICDRDCRSKEYFHSSLGVSVSTLREEFKKHIKPFVSDISKYGIHSIKFGAASNAACKKIAGDLLDIHAGWRCESTKHRYIKHGLSERLAVSKELSI